MSLNIKDHEVYDLAKEIARLTGQSMTAVVRDALRQQRERIQRQQQKEARVAELMAIAARCAAHINEPAAAIDHADMLYDEQGLPR
ncbi:MAG: type II toxin-antitoxin system VapB family antitoxin [Caldilinea sp.]|nr:type II toxin-antitoxin system VapB family antitoxin [Caldilinea sp.]MCB0058361.1 type II toxin-antitoxin system VapB family antitoxin [Caldilineaceae bacterium]MCB0052870.1 type II toxin-antitoxin system VapB family antitoxin [Caldilinea sp.]MCB9113531.1 type II toxin-antitoxin system VapB family antitoxin [Caldilineaceae bacterium]MCB9119006.1 type II toxin-antitoxin system VapB family antitoxin [Caldilineaceae bacterium]